MRILHISDTHGKHQHLPPLPEADVIVHSGDFTFAGSEEEAYDFMNWFSDLPYRHKVFVAGNHDMCLYGAEGIEGLPEDVHYLCNSGVEIDGWRFWGIPLFMEDSINGSQKDYYKQIPSDTDILVTHQPPLGILDLTDYGSGLSHHGDSILRECVGALSLKYHLFGHEHDDSGVQKQGNTVFSNASMLDNSYSIAFMYRLFEMK
ncbi:MAG: metallophosphatase domain-containing protein [Bacteroidales bacterium]|nr:metallophosphatase domain-containing protein [Bacteroidales bacterium]